MAKTAHNAKYPWRTMEVGESFLVSHLPVQRVRDAIAKIQKRTGRAFSAKQCDGEISVTRLPDPTPGPPPVIDRGRGVWSGEERAAFLAKLNTTYPNDDQVQEFLRKVKN